MKYIIITFLSIAFFTACANDGDFKEILNKPEIIEPLK